MENRASSTATPASSTAPPTGDVDKNRPLSWENEVIHRIHRPYYYDYTVRGRDSFRSGCCGQASPETPYPSGVDLTHRSPYCQWGAPDWTPDGKPAGRTA
ncbi:hypothetical protein GCM10022245_69940 [Streptomyces mayteni]